MKIKWLLVTGNTVKDISDKPHTVLVTSWFWNKNEQSTIIFVKWHKIFFTSLSFFNYCRMQTGFRVVHSDSQPVTATEGKHQTDANQCHHQAENCSPHRQWWLGEENSRDNWPAGRHKCNMLHPFACNTKILCPHFDIRIIKHRLHFILFVFVAKPDSDVCSHEAGHVSQAERN